MREFLPWCLIVFYVNRLDLLSLLFLSFCSYLNFFRCASAFFHPISLRTSLRNSSIPIFTYALITSPKRTSPNFSNNDNLISSSSPNSSFEPFNIFYHMFLSSTFVLTFAIQSIAISPFNIFNLFLLGLLSITVKESWYSLC